ncbi:hypothetical protein [Paracoccus cavernae]|uniref:hypothetical protein n=1 Tax=Paracoccus cavernae TaxID=1571207 RepID=UPI00362DBA59
MIRPALAEQLRPWREVISALVCLVFGIWVFAKGGYVFWPLGGAIMAVSAIWGLNARRQMRFRRTIAAPGLVEVDEGAVRFSRPVPWVARSVFAIWSRSGFWSCRGAAIGG